MIAWLSRILHLSNKIPTESFIMSKGKWYFLGYTSGWMKKITTVWEFIDIDMTCEWVSERAARLHTEYTSNGNMKGISVHKY